MYLPSETIAPESGLLNRMDKRFGRSWANSPCAVALDPVNGFVTVCSNVPRTVRTLLQAATARSIVASTEGDDCAATGDTPRIATAAVPAVAAVTHERKRMMCPTRSPGPPFPAAPLLA